MDNQDLDIIEHIKEGSEPHFEMLVNKYKNYIFKIAYGILGNRKDSEDVVQETFINAYYSISTLKDPSMLKMWVSKIATNFAFKFYNANKKMMYIEISDVAESFTDEGLTPEERVMKFDEQVAVYKALETLSFDYRTILVLRDVQGFSYNEIAEILNIPLGTVKSRINEARNQLRKKLINRVER